MRAIRFLRAHLKRAFHISFELDTLQDPRAALRPAVLIYEAQRIAAQAGVDGLQGIDSLKVCRTSQAHVSENGLLVKPL